jgi:hypothetical protein
MRIGFLLRHCPAPMPDGILCKTQKRSKINTLLSRYQISLFKGMLT